MNSGTIFITGQPVQSLISGAVLAAVYGLLLLAACGCASPAKLPPTAAVTESTVANGRLDVRLDTIRTMIDRVKGVISGDVYRFIADQLDRAKVEIVAQSLALSRASAEHDSAVRDGDRRVQIEARKTAAAEKREADLRKNPWVHWALVAQFIFRIWLICLVIAIAVRIVALFVPNAVGALLAKASVTAIGLLTGVTLITSLADNAWFNFLSPKTALPAPG